jgi:hypothetical protein
MLQHLRPVRVVLTPLHLRVLFRESVLALGFALALERESPSLHSFPESRVGGWLIRWCVSCVLMVQLPRQPVLASEQPGFGSSAARLFPVDSADWRSRSRAKGGHRGCPHPPGILPPRDQVTAARVLATPRWELFPLAENEVEEKYFHSRVCVFRRRAHQTARISFLDPLSPL